MHDGACGRMHAHMHKHTHTPFSVGTSHGVGMNSSLANDLAMVVCLTGYCIQWIWAQQITMLWGHMKNMV
jgi:hypothetical protein